jgi:hypothetical protein
MLWRSLSGKFEQGEGEGEDDAEDTDMQDANFVHDLRRSTDE